MQDFSEQEDTGPPISQKLADIINKRWSEKVGEHKLHEKRDKYPRPTNCERVIVPRVNPEIWARIDHYAKQLDLQVSSIHTNLVKVTDAILCYLGMPLATSHNDDVGLLNLT